MKNPSRKPYQRRPARSTWTEWLDPEMHDIDRLAELLAPAADDLLTLHAVSSDVNNVRNKSRHLIDEIEPPAQLV